MSEPTDFDIDTLDAMWVEQRSPDLFTIDLSNARYISHRALLYMVAFARRRRLRDQATKFKLPRDKRVIDYLRAWKFPEAIEFACDVRFEDVLDPDSKWSLAAMPHFSRYESILVTPEGGRESVLSVSYFALTPIRISDPNTPDFFKTSPERAATAERDRWLKVHIKT